MLHPEYTWNGETGPLIHDKYVYVCTEIGYVQVNACTDEFVGHLSFETETNPWGVVNLLRHKSINFKV